VSDFTPVSLLGLSPYVLLVPTALPVKTAADLIALAKAQPGKLSYASGGNGTGTHMAMELFKQKAGNITFTHIPYKGTGPAMTDLMGGQVQALFVSIVAALPQMEGGRVRAIGITSAKRTAMFPNLPTVAESGLPGFEAYGSYGIVAPVGTPRPIIDRLNTEIAKVMNAPDIKARQEKEGVVVSTGTPEDYAKFLRNDQDTWAAVVKSAHITVE
jgi:tripartite-type tricarboxylate transporter receptor subunit TctC